jgi:SAM-dependent methyltransferase
MDAEHSGSVRVDYANLNTEQVAAEHDPFTQRRYEQFARYLPGRATRVLDVGSSIGVGGATLRRVRPDIDLLAFDCVEDRFQRIGAGVYREKLCGLSTGIPVSGACFDAVVAGEFIEHLTYADVLPTLAEFHRVLRPGGRALMTTPNPDSLRIKLTRGTMLGGAHLSAHYPKQLGQMMIEVGFRSPAWCGSGRASTFVGERFPFFDVYGSYVIWADHP